MLIINPGRAPQKPLKALILGQPKWANDRFNKQRSEKTIFPGIVSSIHFTTLLPSGGASAWQ